MSETNFVAQPAPSKFPKRPSPDEEFEAFREVAEELFNDPVKLRALAVSAGICTPDGELTKPYGGK